MRLRKEDVNDAGRGKLGLEGIGGTFRNYKRNVLFMLSKHVVIKDSNEVEVLAILEALKIYSSYNYHNILVESFFKCFLDVLFG